MIGTIRNVIALELASYAGERLWQAGKRGYSAFQAARRDRATTHRPVNLNAAYDPDIEVLAPFRVTVGLAGQSGFIASHDIYAANADEAASWGQRHYDFIQMDLQIVATPIQ